MKKRRVSAKKIFAGVLTFSIFAGSLVGCGNNSSQDQTLVDKVGKISKDYVFRYDELDLGSADDYNYLGMVDDRVYASTFEKNGFITIKSFNSDGSDLKTISIPEAENEGHGYLTFDKDGNFYSVYQIYSDMGGEGDAQIYDDEGIAHAGDDTEEIGEEVAAGAGTEESKDAGTEESKDAGAVETKDAEGADAAAEGESVTDTDPEEMKHTGDIGDAYGEEDKQFLVKYDSQGNEIFRIDLEEGLGEDEYFTMYKMVYSSEFGLITSSNFGVRAFDENTKTFKTIVDTKDPDNEYAGTSISLYNGFNGKMYASCWGSQGMELRSFDPATGKFGEKSSQFGQFDDYSFFEGKGYDLYVSKSDGVYGYDSNKDVLEKIFDYADSDINMNYALSTIVAISDAEFIANLPVADNKFTLCRLTKIPADQVKERTVITLAGSMVDYNVRQKVFRFNKDNPDYKIKVVDYSTLNNSDDWNAGANQFNMDIVSGNTPDIMFFNSDEPVDSYINKGLFVDLMTYIKNDPEMKDVEFVESAFNAFKTGDKLYQLVPSFYVNTVSAKTSLLDGKKTLTVKECEDMIEERGLDYMRAWGIVTQETILNNGLIAAGDKYIDWENKKCNFDSDEFIELLEFTKKFPAQTPDNIWDEYDDLAYMKDEALFSLTYLNGFRSYRRQRDGVFGSDITLIGFPNNSGENFSVITPGFRFAISSKSKYADACWDFIKLFYGEDYQETLMYEFPMRKSTFDKQGVESMDRPYWIDSDGVKQYEDDFVYGSGEQIKVGNLTQEDVDFVKSYVNSLSLVYAPNKNVNNIIMEEASAFFSGQKTAKEVADIIQSRLTIYVNENS